MREESDFQTGEYAVFLKRVVVVMIVICFDCDAIACIMNTLFIVCLQLIYIVSLATDYATSTMLQSG